MTKHGPFLDQAILEIRYSRGHYFFDRVGQVLVEFEQHDPEWVWEQVAPQGATATRDLGAVRVGFSNLKYDLTAASTNSGGKSAPIEIDSFVRYAAQTWKIVKANLLLSEFIRLGVRLVYILPKKSIEHSEQALAVSPLRPLLPDLPGLKVKTRQTIVVFTQGRTEFRVDSGSVIRLQGVPPSPLMVHKPEQLPKHQREVRNRILQDEARYGKNPQFAVKLDVDCFEEDPEAIDIQKFVATSLQTIRESFLPILEKMQ